jgi:hypothetical protein
MIFEEHVLNVTEWCEKIVSKSNISMYLVNK